MLAPYTFHRVDWNCSIEGREYATALYGKAEQIHIGELLMADYPLGIEEPVIDQADLIGQNV